MWKVAEIAGTREIRLGIRKRMGNAFYSPASGSDISYFCNVESTNTFRVSYDYKLLFVESVGATKSATFGFGALNEKQHQIIDMSR